MKYKYGTKAQFINELVQLQEGIVQQEAMEAEHKNIENALRESEEKYRNLVERANDGILIIQDRLIKFANSRLAEMWGGAIEEILNTPFVNYVHTDELPKIVDRHNERMADKRVPTICETVLRRKDGSKLDAELNVGIITYQGNTAELVIVRDITERKKAEEELKLNAYILNNTTDGIFLHDFEGNPVFVNEMAYKSLGYTREELMSLNIRQIDTEEHVDIINLKMRSLAEEGSITFETVHRCKNGALMPVEVNARVIESGGRKLILGVVRDITERKKAEEELQLRSQLLDNATDTILALDISGNIIFANETASKSFGYSREELMSMTIMQLSAVERAKTFKTLQQKLLEKDTITFETTNKRKDGSIIPVEVHERLIELGGRKLVLSVIRDITERKQTELKLLEDEKRYRTLFEQSRDPVYISTRQGKFVDCNQAMLSLFDYTREEMIGMDVHNIFVDPADWKKFQWAIEGKGSVVDYEINFQKKDGTAMDCLLTATVNLDDDKNIIGYQGTIRDITERKRTMEELKQSYEELQKVVEGAIEAIASIAETRDPYTAGHQRRVSKLASAIAEELGLSKKQIEMIRVAGILHDIGKVSVPAEILSKPGKLSELELNMIRIHPQVGREILKTLKLPWPICPIVLQHHERMDGSGYPNGASGEEISLEARVLAAADVVEAMSSHRPYRPTLGIEKALEEISHNRGILYDPLVVDTCLRLFNEKRFTFE